ncbi:TetR family transcriptional regulator [Paenibacillus thalictri]|uniref:TetR family transcriptional regulator n=1 Tax=Paenibacillus thalictri TaxID=2527873 RepID=A0A4Q9DIC2_9BACL|nr:TetR family transcriptional regulator [Paenibacillus thalictri]
MAELMRDSTRKKRQYMIDVALRMFSEKGFEEVSVDDVIAATNTSKGTFYHYFKSKDEIIREVPRRQDELIRAWMNEPPSKVTSLEGHVNRLFLDLAYNIHKHPKLMRSLMAMSLQTAVSPCAVREHFRLLSESLNHWLPDPNKAELLVSTYKGTLLTWCTNEEGDLVHTVREQLARVWSGIRTDQPVPPIALEPRIKEETSMKVAIIGGGLAGLTAAAYLSEQSGVEGVLFERSPQLGGRAFTYEKSGFTLNYGAHAIYGIDRHTISDMERELGLSFSSKQVDKRRVMYAKNGQLTPAPLDFVNLIRTELLSPIQKMRFVGEISAIIANIHNLKNYATLGDYLAASGADEDVKELWEHLVCSNFFIAPEDARKVPGPVISEYYHNLFMSARPVNYILGSWAVITNQLRQKIELAGRWEIALQEGVDGIRYADRQFYLKTKNRELAFDKVIFAMPVQQVVKLLKGTAWEPFLAPYENNSATEVMVYDIGLNQVAARPFSYISDMDNKLFISDVSATDHTLVPEGGQLLQGIAYLNDNFEDEAERKAYLESKTSQMEQLFDHYYPTWREHVTVKRVSKKAMVSSVKNIGTNNLVPVRIENMPFYFCGDGCVGKGELAERAFSSGRSAAKLILEDAAQPALAR